MHLCICMHEYPVVSREKADFESKRNDNRNHRTHVITATNCAIVSDDG